MRADHRLRRGRFGSLGGSVLAALQQGAGAGNVPLPTVVAQEAVMADANQPGRQNVPAKTPQELSGVQGERFDGAALAVIAPSKGHGLGRLVHGQEAPVTPGDSVGVVGQVIQHLLRSPKGALGRPHPFLSVELGQPALAHWAIRPGGIAQAPLLGFEPALEPSQELASESSAQGNCMCANRAAWFPIM